MFSMRCNWENILHITLLECFQVFLGAPRPLLLCVVC